MKKRILTAIMAVAVTVVSSTSASILNTQTADAATMKLSAKKVTLRVGSTKTLKVTGTNKKIVWKTSNKKVISITPKGKKKITANALNVGKATITAKIGKKKLTCRFIVNTDDLNPTTPSRPAKELKTNDKNSEYLIAEEDTSLSNLDVNSGSTKETTISDIDFTFISLDDMLCVKYKNQSSQNVHFRFDVAALDSKGNPISSSEVVSVLLVSQGRTGYASCFLSLNRINISRYHIYNINIENFDSVHLKDCTTDIKLTPGNSSFDAKYTGDFSDILGDKIELNVATLFYDKNNKLIYVRYWDITQLKKSENYKKHVDFLVIPENADRYEITCAGAYYQYSEYK